MTPFFLVERGECSFVKKVRNLENIGVSVAIVIDDTDEEIENVIMSDEGNGGGIRIPSMIISKNDGKKLVDYILRSTPEERKQTAVAAYFKLDRPDNRVEYDIFYSSGNDKALDFIDDFAPTDVKLGDHVLMTPRIVTWSC